MSNQSEHTYAALAFLGLTDQVDTSDLIDPNTMQLATDEDFLLAVASVRSAEEMRRGNHEQRIARCGRWCYRYSQHTGAKLWFRFRCDCWRDGECERCMGRRAKLLQMDVEQNVNRDGGLHMVEFETKEEADTFLRKAGLDKSAYIRIPTLEGDKILVDGKAIKDHHIQGSRQLVKGSTVEMVDGEPLDDPNTLSTTDIDWTIVAMTPRGRNKSGLLKLEMPKEEDDVKDTKDRVRIKVETVMPEGLTHEQVTQAMDAAIDATLDLHPTTAEEVEKALAIRTAAFKAEIARMGGTIGFSEVKREWVEISRIDWSKSKEIQAKERQSAIST